MESLFRSIPIVEAQILVREPISRKTGQFLRNKSWRWSLLSTYMLTHICTSMQPPTRKHTKRKNIWASYWNSIMWKERQSVEDKDSARQSPEGQGWWCTGFKVQFVSATSTGQQEKQNKNWEATLMRMKRAEADGTGHFAFMPGLLGLSLKLMTTSVVIITITQIAT